MRRYNYIYKITNLTNGKIYIGKHSTDNLDDGYFGSGKLIKQSIQKRGIENFKKEYLVFTDNEERLNWFERYYIKKYKTYNSSNGYNLTKGGDGTLGHIGYWNGKVGPTKGKPSPRRGKPAWNKGLKGVQVAWNKGKSWSEETKKKISESQIGRTAWNKGLKMSEEYKLKRTKNYRNNNK